MNDQTPRNLGQGMLIGAWVLLLALLVMAFNRVLERRENPNPDPVGRSGPNGTVEVVLERNAQGHYVAGGSIDGYPVTFLVDTGATTVALSDKLAQRLGLEKRGGIFTGTANGVAAGWQTRLAQVRIGPIVEKEVRAVILPDLKPWNQVLLGMSFLKRLEMVQRDGRLLLRQGRSSASSSSPPPRPSPEKG